MVSEELVSIITPSYNTGKYIGETIESVLSQTYKNWELLIVDDCSTDNTDVIVKKYLSDSRIKYIKNATNSGAAISRNLGIQIAKGRWIAFLDSDDLWLPNKLEKQVEYMKKNNIAFSYTQYEEIDEDSNPTGRVISGPYKISKMMMKAYCWIGCLTVMYDIGKIGVIQIENIEKNNDYALWLKIINKSSCFLYPQILGKYRKRKGSISNQNYFKLVRWHYKLWHTVENQSSIISIGYTMLNIFFGLIKKIVYEKNMDKI